jgi:serine/threonine-protein kinase RsbW
VHLSLELELAARPDGLPWARGAITELCERLDVDEEVVERVRIAVTEACSNCVRHAYDGEQPSSTYLLETRVEDNALIVVVNDCGMGMGMAEPSKHAGFGLGLRLIRELADSAHISSRPGHGTRVVMRFQMSAAA